MKPQRIKWVMLACATLMIGACNADTSLLEPELVMPVQQRAVVAPQRIKPAAPIPAAEAARRGRGRYAMAAS